MFPQSDQESLGSQHRQEMPSQYGMMKYKAKNAFRSRKRVLEGEQQKSSSSSKEISSSGSDYMKLIKDKRRGRGRRGRPRGLKLETNNIYMSNTMLTSAIKNRKEDGEIKKSDIFMESEQQNYSNEQNSRKNSSDSKSQQEHALQIQQQSQDSEKRQKQEILQSIQKGNESQGNKSNFLGQSDQDSQQFAIDLEQQQINLKKQPSVSSRKVKVQNSKQDSIFAQSQQNQFLKQDQQKKKALQKKQQIKEFAMQLPDYEKRRVMKYINGKLDLNVRYLHQIVYECYEEDLICQQLMLGIKFMGLGNSLQYIQKYKNNALSQFDFTKVKFTLFDHRRLTQLLKEKGTKKQYTDEKPLYFLPYELHLFMSHVYTLPEDTYKACCMQFDQAYQLTWWKSIGTQLKGKEPEKKTVPEETKPNVITKQKKKQTKRIRYKAKPEDPKAQKEANLKLEDSVLQKQSEKNQKPDSQQKEAMIEQKQKRKKTLSADKQSIFSSSVFDTEKILDSSLFSMDSKTHSLSDVSDLLHQSNQPKNKKRPNRRNKQELQQKEFTKAKKSQADLKKVERNFKKGQKKKSIKGKIKREDGKRDDDDSVQQ